MWGRHSNPDNDGLTELKLSDQAYDNVNYILFADNSGRTTPFIAQVSILMRRLSKATLLERLVIFRNASNFIKRNEDGSFDKSKLKDLENKSVLNLSQSTLTGAVINQFDTFRESSSYYYQISKENNTTVVLTQSQWTGDLKDEVNLNGNSAGRACRQERSRKQKRH